MADSVTPMISTLLIAVLTLASVPAQAPQPAKPDAKPRHEPYVVQFEALDAAGATRAENALRSMAGISRLESNPREATLRVWAKRADGASRPQLLNPARIRERLKKQDLGVSAIREPDWSKFKVYVVEAAGGG